jgi:UDP-N-acetyl-2-amino-2-deoxyglucuronate dehydrogenase
MLVWIFGGVKNSTVHVSDAKKSAGLLELQKANVRWFLSLDRNDLPAAPAAGKPATHRSITIDGQELEFSEGFADLHTESYKKILAGEGFTTKDVMASVQIASDIRGATPIGLKGDYHPMLTNRKNKI